MVVKEEEGLFVLLPSCRGGEGGGWGGEEKAGRDGEDRTGAQWKRKRRDRWCRLSEA